MQDTICDKVEYINSLLLCRDTSKIRIEEHLFTIQKKDEEIEHQKKMNVALGSVLNQRTNEVNEKGYKIQELEVKIENKNKFLRILGTTILLESTLLFIFIK